MDERGGGYHPRLGHAVGELCKLTLWSSHVLYPSLPHDLLPQYCNYNSLGGQKWKLGGCDKYDVQCVPFSWCWRQTPLLAHYGAG